MSKAALTSIQPPNTDNIFNQIKGIEWRTKPLPMCKHYCYETKKRGGVGKVIGEFKIWRVKRYENASLIPEFDIALGCVTREFLMRYSKGGPLYANYIIKSIKYDKPKDLSGFYRKCEKMPCEVCEHLKYQKVNQSEYDYDCEFLNYKIPLTRPPQSWCYVEEVSDG